MYISRRDELDVAFPPVAVRRMALLYNAGTSLPSFLLNAIHCLSLSLSLSLSVDQVKASRSNLRPQIRRAAWIVIVRLRDITRP